ISFLSTDTGSAMLARARELDLDIEYELHALAELLPRDLFDANPELFRVNEDGDRAPDSNLCPSNGRALEIVGENAVRMSETLTPTTHRYYYWSDDGKPWCGCRKCAGLNDADQSLLVTNAILAALRTFDPDARVAGLAYHGTQTPPTQVRPADGVFLEYAPIERQWDRPIADRSIESHARLLDGLDAAIETYGVDQHSQVLEYWMDASRHSRWKRPAVAIPWHPDVLAADLEFYASKGFRRMTSFGCFLDAEYVDLHGEPPVVEYGAALLGGS
ncbi:MAG TPA: DUF4838 domain-containing protein, partial [Armatimonadota bacterium]|nr:DUF4838 domain-containing protein [Armatimonadota bacterium]